MSSDAIIEMVPAGVGNDKPKNRKKLYIIGGTVAAALLAVGGAYWSMQPGGESGTEEVSASASAGADSSSYIEVPQMIVNLRSGDRQARFLKLRFIIVAADASKAETVKDRLPAVLDGLQPFLRELRPDDLNGSAAVFRIKEEMMSRATQALGAGMVRDILIQDLVQQ